MMSAYFSDNIRTFGIPALRKPCCRSMILATLLSLDHQILPIGVTVPKTIDMFTQNSMTFILNPLTLDSVAVLYRRHTFPVT